MQKKFRSLPAIWLFAVLPAALWARPADPDEKRLTGDIVVITSREPPHDRRFVGKKGGRRSRVLLLHRQPRQTGCRKKERVHRLGAPAALPAGAAQPSARVSEAPRREQILTRARGRCPPPGQALIFVKPEAKKPLLPRYRSGRQK
jgi:hypothetical protein